MKNLMAACSVFVMGVGLATTAFAVEPVIPDEETCYDCPDETKPKGNNGWGNGVDGTNPGTDEGTKWQVDTKSNVPGLDLGKFAKFGGR